MNVYIPDVKLAPGQRWVGPGGPGDVEIELGNRGDNGRWYARWYPKGGKNRLNDNYTQLFVPAELLQLLFGSGGWSLVAPPAPPKVEPVKEYVLPEPKVGDTWVSPEGQILDIYHSLDESLYSRELTAWWKPSATEGSAISVWFPGDLLRSILRDGGWKLHAPAPKPVKTPVKEEKKPQSITLREGMVFTRNRLPDDKLFIFNVFDGGEYAYVAETDWVGGPRLMTQQSILDLIKKRGYVLTEASQKIEAESTCPSPP